MNVLAVGLDHQSAPADLLDRVSLDAASAILLAQRLAAAEDVAEVVVLATCHRLEVYAAVRSFHGGLSQTGEALAGASGVPVDELSGHLRVHYDERAVSHLFSVACGLESMALGENQILGQVRTALRGAQRRGEIGPVLNPLFQQALRVGRAARRETGLDTVARSLVELGLDAVQEQHGALGSARVLVVGSGAMSALTLATLERREVTHRTVVGRTRARAERLGLDYAARVRPWAELLDAVVEADVVVSGTAAREPVLTADLARRALSRRGPSRGELVVLDLAVPSDTEPAVGDLPGVSRLTLQDLSGRVDRQRPEVAAAVHQVRELVTAEVAEHLTRRQAQELGPTVAALRAQASRVVGAELTRLEQRTPQLSEAERAEVRRTVARVVDKLLHTPTVRVKELDAGDGRGEYAHALRELFDLDPHDTAVVSIPPVLPVRAPAPTDDPTGGAR